MTALAPALTELGCRLAQAGIAEPRREARLLVAAATGLSQAALLADPDRRLDELQSRRLDEFARRRAGREPLSRILGWREFWSLRFALGVDTLDPRPDSETLVEAALEWVGGERARPWQVLDLGTGSGCLLLALLSELPAARGLGIDISPGAVAIAEANARSLGLSASSRFAVGDWAMRHDGTFDIVLCNPPYVAAGDIEGLEPEVRRFDPRLALSGGPDGLDAYRALAVHVPRLLGPGARAFIEIGRGQGEAVTGLFEAAGLCRRGIRKDLAGTPRCLVLGQKKTVGNPLASD